MRTAAGVGDGAHWRQVRAADAIIQHDSVPGHIMELAVKTVDMGTDTCVSP